VVDLTTRVTRAAQTFVEVRADGSDALPFDDTFNVPLSVSDMLRVLIVDGTGQEGAEEAAATPAGALKPGPSREEASASTESGPRTLSGARILRFALNPARELGQAHGTGIATTVVTPEALAGQPLSKYGLIVLYDVNSLSESALKDLDGFVRQGAGLLIVCSGGCKPMKFNRSFAAAGAEHGALCPARVGNEVELDPPVGISLGGTLAHPVMAAFRDRLQGDLSVVRFTKVREVSDVVEGAAVMFQDTSGRPLAVEMRLPRGRIALLTVGLELDRGNIARTRAFPVLLWRMVEHLTGRLESSPPDVLTALRPAVLDVSEPAFSFVQELELAPVAAVQSGASGATAEEPRAAAPLRLTINKDRTVLVPGLQAGQYQLRKPTPKGEPAPVMAYTRFVSVNPDPRESDMTRMDKQDLARLFGERVRIVDARKGADITPRGAELWRMLAVMLAAAYLAEGCVGWLLSARREKQRGEGVAA